jgi:hypothetical protein
MTSDGVVWDHIAKEDILVISDHVAGPSSMISTVSTRVFATIMLHQSYFDVFGL